MVVTVFGLLLLVVSGYASRGDTSNEYTGCYHICHFNNCTSDVGIAAFKSSQSLSEKVLQWSCDDECKYNCMWHTTEIFMNRGFDVPQFFGKWPFARIWGMQEPASVLFSVFNLLAHIINLQWFNKTVPKVAPLYKMWIFHAVEEALGKVYVANQHVFSQGKVYSTEGTLPDVSAPFDIDYFVAHISSPSQQLVSH